VNFSSGSLIARFCARIGAGMIFCLALGSCGWWSDDKGFIVDRSEDYLKAEEGEGLAIPEGLDSAAVQAPFAIPPITTANASTYPNRAPRPAPLYANGGTQDVKIQKLGERRWLVLHEPPAVIWPKIKQFLAENGVETAFEEAPKGLITTDWIEVGEADRDVVRLVIQQAKSDAGVSGGKERINIGVEQGMRENTTEIHLRHENDVLQAATEPSSRRIAAIESALAGVEEGLLRELGAYLASDVSSQTVSMVGRELVGATKAELGNDSQGQPILKLNLDFDRAWASIGQALQNAEVEVTDLDRSTGVYFIDLPEKALTGEENSGFFKRLLGGRGGDVLAMQIRVTELPSGGYQVQALDADAGPAEPELARDVLNLIREFAV